MISFEVGKDASQVISCQGLTFRHNYPHTTKIIIDPALSWLHEFGIKKDTTNAEDFPTLTTDIVEITEDVEAFMQEHTHSEPEARQFLAGGGVFWFRQEHTVLAVFCKVGDLIQIPAHLPHWFELGPNPYAKVKRFFGTPEGGEPCYTERPLGKVTLQFDLSEDSQAAVRALKADGVYDTLYELAYELRQVYRYSEQSNEIKYAEIWRERLQGLCCDNGIDLEDY